jgi:hypothetical protein
MKPDFRRGESGLSKIPTWIDCDGTLKQVRELIAAQGSEGDSVIVMKNDDVEALGGLTLRAIKRAG